ncbi:unnamed protein product, partial [Mesorhabditis spiculigera]
MRCLSQFWLLTLKNLILMWRNKVWTLVELILPLLIGVPLLIKAGDWVEPKQDRDSNFVRPQPLTMNPTPSTYVYTVAIPGQRDIAALLMTTYQEVIKEAEDETWPPPRLYGTREAMAKFLADDPWQHDAPSPGPRGALGIEILNIDVKAAVFDYRIWVPGMAAEWKFDQNWAFFNSLTDELGGTTINRVSPYATNRALKMQWLLDDAFIKMTTAKEPSPRVRKDVDYFSFPAMAPPLKAAAYVRFCGFDENRL